jgi:biopolymer transport protein ExbD
VQAIYDKEVFAGFSSPRGFPRINVVSLVDVYFSVILFLLCSYLMKCKEL